MSRRDRLSQSRTKSSISDIYFRKNRDFSFQAHRTECSVRNATRDGEESAQTRSQGEGGGLTINLELLGTISAEMAFLWWHVITPFVLF